VGAESASQQVFVSPTASEAAVSGSPNSLSSDIVNFAADMSAVHIDESAPIADVSSQVNEIRPPQVAEAAAGESSVPGKASAPSHEHSKRAKDMSFEEALGATGCSYLRTVAATQGKEKAREVFDTLRPTDEPSKPVKLVMPPPKKKSADPPVLKKADTPQDQIRVETTKATAQARPIEVQPVTPLSVEALKDVLPVITEVPKLPAEAVFAPARQEAAISVVVALPEQLTATATQSSVEALERLAVPELAFVPYVAPEAGEVSAAIEESREVGDHSTTTVGTETEVFEPAPIAASEVSEIFVVAAPEADKPSAEQSSPTVTFERFTEALSLFVNEASMQLVDGPAELSSEHSPLEPRVAAVATEVASKLVDLTVEQKEAALPIVQGVAESLRMVKQLQNNAATPKEIAVAVEEMRGRVVRLFEAIGVDYDDQKIEYFIQAMLASDFVISNQTSLTPEELARMGTHEVKLTNQFALLLSHATIPDDTHASHRLGRIVLFFTRPSFAPGRL
jgi:hypothetical protein